MAKINKVLYNIDQTGDTSSDEKAQARTNIGASQITYDSSVSDMTITKEIVRPYMNTKYTATVGNDGFLLLPNTFADGMVVKSNDSLNTRAFPKEVPSGGSNGQVLTWNDNTYDWANPSSDLPSHSSADAGKVLTVNVGGQAVWQTPTVGASDFGVYELTVTKVLNGTGTELWDGEGLTDANISESYTNCTAATCPVSVGLNGYGGLRVYLDNRYGSITCESHTYVSSNANFANELGMWGYDNLCQMVAGMNRTWYVTDGSNLDQNGIRTTTETLKSGTLTIKFDFVFQV